MDFVLIACKASFSFSKLVHNKLSGIKQIKIAKPSILMYKSTLWPIGYKKPHFQSLHDIYFKSRTPLGHACQLFGVRADSFTPLSVRNFFTIQS